MTDEERPLIEHLTELRKRLVRCLIAVAVGMIASYLLYDIVILDIARGPIDLLSGREENPFARWSPFGGIIESLRLRFEDRQFPLHYISPSEGFAVKLKLSFLCGIIVSLPVIVFQIWRFIAVGLRRKEQRRILIYFPISLLLFFVGILFAYFITVPAGLYFLVNVSRDLIPMITISKYTSLVFLLTLVFGLIFELPLTILFMTRLGLITPKFLSEKRKFAILLVFVVAALLTPPDVFTQVLLAIPILILYEVSIWISKFAQRKSKQTGEAEG